MSGVHLAVRRLLVVAAALVLLGHGGAELGPRLSAASVVAASAPTPTAGRPAPVRPAAESQPVQRGATLRIPTASAVVPAGSVDPAAGPGSLPLSVPRLVSRADLPVPAADALGDRTGRPSGRAPPEPAGT